MESNIEKSEDNKNNDNDDCNIYIDRIRHKSVINDIVDSHCMFIIMRHPSRLHKEFQPSHVLKQYYLNIY